MARIGAQFALLLAIVATIGCDRVTKHLAAENLEGLPARSFLADTIRLEFVENTGGFLGLGANLPPRARTALFTVATGMMLLGLIALAIGRQWRRLPLFGLALFVAGGASNWADRVVRGSVVDFMNVGVGSLRTGIFNVADVAIMLGAALLLLGEFGRARPAGQLQPPEPR
jgi:signal peptidase II